MRAQSQYFVGWCDSPRDALALDTGEVLTHAQAEQAIFDELLARETIEHLGIHSL